MCAKYINGKLIVTKSDEQVNKIVKKYKIQKEVKKKFNQLKKYKIINEQICRNIFCFTILFTYIAYPSGLVCRVYTL